MKKSKGPKIPQIYDVLVAVEKMDKEKKGTKEHDSAKDIAVKEIAKYNEYHGKRGFGTNIKKARGVIQFRNKRLKEEAKQRELAKEFKNAQRARDYKDNQGRGKRKWQIGWKN